MLRYLLILIGTLYNVAAASQAVHPQDVVINEILFNPKPGAFDYVELYNRSDSAVDLSGLFLTNKTSTGYGTLKKLYDTTLYLSPKSYVVFTENAESLALHYFVKNP